jgi:Anti-sigma factor NepR
MNTAATLSPPRPMYTRPQPQNPKAPRAMLDRSLQGQLGRQLKAIFDDIVEEPVPGRFIRLLQELETKEKRQ